MPARDRLSWFRFNPQDHISDPAVRAMSYDEQGRYWVLICTLYIENTANATETQVRTWAGYSEIDWVAHREAFAKAFRIRRDGRWIQKRVEVEVRTAKMRVEKARKGGVATARKRWGSVAVLLPSDSGASTGTQGTQGTQTHKENHFNRSNVASAVDSSSGTGASPGEGNHGGNAVSPVGNNPANAPAADFEALFADEAGAQPASEGPDTWRIEALTGGLASKFAMDRG